jgi:hypothetical protein
MSQLPTATILGTVKDSAGAIIPGVGITAKNLGTGLTRNAVGAVNGSKQELQRDLDLPRGRGRLSNHPRRGADGVARLSKSEATSQRDRSHNPHSQSD